MAERALTLADIRAAVKHPGSNGILSGGWKADSGQPLFPPLQEMADDIAKWLNPVQGWKLVEVRTGFINLKRIEKSFSIPAAVKRVVAKREEPDKFTPFFHFDAENPPIVRSLLRKVKGIDFPQVFVPEFKDRVNIWCDGNANVFPNKIGSTYSLEQAKRELTSPYFLVGATVSLNYRETADRMFGVHAEKPRTYDPPKSLAVIVFMQDLADYLRLEELKIRRIRRHLDKTFPIEAFETSTKESEPQPTREILEEDMKEFEQFAEQLTPYHHRYMVYLSRLESIDPKSSSHPIKMMETGFRCRAIRKQCGLSRDEIAQQVGVELVQLAAFEGGLIPPADLPEGFAQKLSAVLTKGLEQKATSSTDKGSASKE